MACQVASTPFPDPSKCDKTGFGGNDVSEKPLAQYAETVYTKALEIQEDALKDGYIVSADIDWDPVEEVYYVSCVTIINGDLWAWNPESDEPVNYSDMVNFMEVK